MEPLTDDQKEMFENLWGDLRAMYQRDVAMADNGIPFRARIEDFIKEYNSTAHNKRSDECEGCVSAKKELEFLRNSLRKIADIKC